MKRYITKLIQMALTLATGICLVAIANSSYAEGTNIQGDSERLTQQSWDALNNSDYQLAIQKAEHCIKGFRGTADILQKSLKDKDAPLPPIGAVRDENERRAIFDRGCLNDVATCYFIIGEAQSGLADRSEASAKKEHVQKAKAAYEAAARYTYARTWDLRGWFWDPSATSNERIAGLEPVGS
jgi:hypothetical protein